MLDTTTTRHPIFVKQSGKYCRHCNERIRFGPYDDRWRNVRSVEWKDTAECEKNEEGHEPR